MANNRFTPGPWRFGENDASGYGDKKDVPFIIKSEEWVLAGIIGDVDDIDVEANARLIAAAPTLFAELENIIRCDVPAEGFKDWAKSRAQWALDQATEGK